MRKTDKATKLHLQGTWRKVFHQQKQFHSLHFASFMGRALSTNSKGDGKTFAQLADSAFKLAVLEVTSSARIYVVFDVYRDTSIKNAERCNRHSVTGTQLKNIAPAHSILQWKKFLRMPENKIGLIQFLICQWQELTNMEKLQDKSLFVTCYLTTTDHSQKNSGHTDSTGAI